MSTPHKATHSQQPASQVGEVFVRKYDLLLQWALRLTHGDREQAEDLLHEAFIHFTLRQLDFAGVENLDGYLYTVLKYFHRSFLRRAKRDPLNPISLVEFDSIDLALRSSFDFDQVEVQNDLRRICAFLCWRKATTKSASYLILRFFHGYYPEEITRIALTSRNVIDQGIKLASSEAKTVLTDPGRLRFMQIRLQEGPHDDPALEASESAPSFEPVLFALPAKEFLRVLDQIIISSRADACLPREELLRHYAAPSDANASSTQSSIGRTLLAHLVSCPDCLDAVNHHLQMPPLSDRFPGERLGSYRRGNAVRRGSQMRNEQAFQEMRLAKDSILKIAQARLRECYEHQPKKLFIAVNGDIVATQDVTSDHNKQSIRLHHRKAVEFIEVFSEQGIRLAFISVMSMPPEGPDSLSQKVSLSAGRSLDAAIEFTSSGPLLEVVYNDPLLAHSVDFLEAELDQSLQLIADLKSSLETSEQQDSKREPFLIRLGRRWSVWMDSFRPLVISGAIALLIALTVGLYFAHIRHKAMEAKTLLAVVAQREGAVIPKGHIVHRTLAFEVTSQDGKNVIQQGTVEVWKSADGNQLAERLTSEDGKLVGGIWKVADGYSIYRNQKLASRAAAPANLGSAVAPADSDDMWMNQPSAIGFETLAGNQGAIAVENSGDESVIDYRPTSTANTAQPRLVRANLIVHRDHHVAGQIFWIESGNEIRRYSYRETSYEERDAEPSDGAIFSPDPGLAQSHASIRREISPASANSAFLAHLNLEAFALLNSVNADSGEQIAVKRSPSRLSISGVLQSEERLAQVKNALAPLASNPLVDIALVTTAQQDQHAGSPRKVKSATPVTVESYDIDAQTIPAQDRLKAYFSRRGHSGKDLDQQIENFCQDTLSHSSHALQQSWTLHTLASSFSPRDWQHMSVNDRKQWIALYLRHSTALQTEAQAIRQSLNILSLNPAGETAESNPNSGDATPSQSPGQISLNTLSDQLLEQSSAADRVLRSALTASTGPLPDLDPLCKQLQASLENTDRAIREIERRAQELEANQAAR